MSYVGAGREQTGPATNEVSEIRNLRLLKIRDAKSSFVGLRLGSLALYVHILFPRQTLPEK